MTNEIGEFIRRKRKEANLTLKQVSEGAGISYPYLSTVETGKRENPSAEVLNKIANVLGVPSVEILTIGGYLNSGDTEKLPDKYNEMKRLSLLNPLEVLTFTSAEVVRNILKSYVELNKLNKNDYELLNVSDAFLGEVTTKEYVDSVIVKHKELLHIYVFIAAITQLTGENMSPIVLWKWTENLPETSGIVEAALKFDGFAIWEKLYFNNNFLDDYEDYELQSGKEDTFDVSALMECDTVLFKGKILSPRVIKTLRTLLDNA